MYLLGTSFVIYTDHKALVSLFNNPRRNPPFRIERIRLKLQGFNFTIAHITGKLNPSDYASRHPLPSNSNDDTCISKDLSAYINEIILSCKPVTINEIEHNTHDETMRKVMKLLSEGRYPRKEDEIPMGF